MQLMHRDDLVERPSVYLAQVSSSAEDVRLTLVMLHTLACVRYDAKAAAALAARLLDVDPGTCMTEAIVTLAPTNLTPTPTQQSPNPDPCPNANANPTLNANPNPSPNPNRKPDTNPNPNPMLTLTPALALALTQSFP